MCDNKDLLIGYLYDDVTAEERRTFAAHLQHCADCREELAALDATRAQLAAWSPPERTLGFRIVSDAAPAPAAAKVLPFRTRWMPAFGMAAAAVLVLAVATAIANIEVRYDNAGLIVRTGWARTPDASSMPTAVGDQRSPERAQAVDGVSWRADFAALQSRLDQLQKVVDAQPPSAAPRIVAGVRMSDAEMLNQVRTIVREAEARQQVAVAQRLLQVIDDLDRQHRADVVALQQGLGQYQGLTDMQMLNTREQINQLKRVATRQEK
jgi:hypothetical protein